mmetsp:Transcript_8115/g.23044  ORF Transcript_8115/g.23044 Transcript_8115/m.23044 type:complete len:218 (-) Transcript_8115:380-1033(-)
MTGLPSRVSTSLTNGWPRSSSAEGRPAGSTHMHLSRKSRNSSLKPWSVRPSDPGLCCKHAAALLILCAVISPCCEKAIKGSRPSAKTMHTVPTAQMSTDLVYEWGRWLLKTAVNGHALRSSISGAIRHIALDMPCTGLGVAQRSSGPPSSLADPKPPSLTWPPRSIRMLWYVTPRCTTSCRCRSHSASRTEAATCWTSASVIRPPSGSLRSNQPTDR